MEKAVRNNSILMRFINNAQSKPARMIALSFLFVIFIGSILLSLPLATANGEPTGILKAVFTATSATQTSTTPYIPGFSEVAVQKNTATRTATSAT